MAAPLILLTALMVSIGQILLAKLPTLTIPLEIKNILNYSSSLSIACLFYALGLFLWVYTLSVYPLRYAYPVLVSASLIGVTLITSLVDKTSYSRLELVGFIFVMIGSVLITTKSFK